ncbi:chaperonin GroS [Blakeslea trispora]|nr:chaperonin GroS [Blakeslea trispora]
MSTANKLSKFVPLLDRVLVQRIKPQQTTASGIFIPEKAQEALNEGYVVAVGKGVINKEGVQIPKQVDVGDKVILPPFGGHPVKFEKEEYLLIRDSEILAKLAN